MLKLNIHEAKTYLSQYVEKLLKGEVIILCRRNVPIAEIRGISEKARTKKRPIGLYKGDFTLPKTFFEPLPDEVLSEFEGK